MPFSLGKVSYVNALPLFCAGGFEGFEVFSEPPSSLNARVARAEPAAAMISRWVYEDGADALYGVLPEYGIFGDGEIMSVKIFSKVPFEDFPKASIFITSETGTSSRAFAFLFKKKYGADIFSMPRATLESADAALLIGDEALAFPPREFCADLGEMWREEVGLPMMYSVFAVRRDVEGEVAPMLREGIEKSLAAFEADPGAVVDSALRVLERAGRRCSRAVIEKYYSRLKYSLPPETFKKAFDFVAAHAGA